jgi:hypothetical protein
VAQLVLLRSIGKENGKTTAVMDVGLISLASAAWSHRARRRIHATGLSVYQSNNHERTRDHDSAAATPTAAPFEAVNNSCQTSPAASGKPGSQLPVGTQCVVMLKGAFNTFFGMSRLSTHVKT